MLHVIDYLLTAGWFFSLLTYLQYGIVPTGVFSNIYAILYAKTKAKLRSIFFLSLIKKLHLLFCSLVHCALCSRVEFGIFF